MLDRVFELHGRFCAGHPLEVIVTTFILTACMLNMETATGGANTVRDGSLPVSAGHCWHGRCASDDLNAADVILMTMIRCLAILFSYHQFRNLQNLGSKYILGIAGLFTMFSSIIFTSSVLNFGRSDISDLKDALFFFLLVIDLNKAGILAQLALNSKSQDEVRVNIARGMSLLGPSVTLDTLVEILLIGIGSLSGVRRLEILCGYACLGVVVNYVVFMTFYPACLSLVLELSRSSNDKILMTHGGLLNEEDQKPNPVVERLKLIMIAGLFVVHAHSRWPFRNEDAEEAIDETVSTVSPSILLTNRNKTEAPPDFKGYLINWLSVSADNIVILILLLALAIKFIFFEDRGEIVRQLRFEEEEAATLSRRSVCEEESCAEMESKLRQRFASAMSLSSAGTTTRMTSRSAVFPMGGMGEDWIEVGGDNDVQLIDKEVQTDDKLLDTSSSSSDTLCSKSDTLRTVEECLSIYRSELGANALTDPEVIQLVKHKYIQSYQLEKAVGDMERGVGIRRCIVGAAGRFYDELHDLPYRNYDYSKVLGSCCENVVGYVPVPVGIAGPLLIDGELIHVPMATTEGCLVASTNRGSRALMNCGVTSRVVADGMTRGQWRKHVRIKYGGRVGVGQGQQQQNHQHQRDREEVITSLESAAAAPAATVAQLQQQQPLLQVRVLQLQGEGGTRLNYVCHQPQLISSNLLLAPRRGSAAAMLCCGRRKEGRGEVTDISASPGRQVPVNQLRPKEPPPMVIQGDFRKVSGITSEIFKQLETVENDHDASTAAYLDAVDKHGEMVVRVIEPRQMGRQASEAAKKFVAMQDPKHPIHFVEIIKRPGQTLGLYIREGNGVDRNDGVFISRIAVETAVHNSGCLKVGDEILAVNLVDVTHMSLDDVVIIMSIPRRLVLAIRHGPHQLVPHSRQNEHKAPPVVVIKKELNEDENEHITSNHIGSRSDNNRRRGDGREMLPSRSKLGLSGLGSTQDIVASNGDLYYNSRPESHIGWSYQPPPPPVITQQPKPTSTQHFQPYERGYPKTLESLAEKVHSFYPPTASNGTRRMSAGTGMQSSTMSRLQSAAGSHYATAYGQHPSVTGRVMPRSGSDQHLPRVDYTSITTPARHTLLRSSLKTGSSALRYGTRYGAQNDTLSSQRQGQFGTLTRRHRPSLDYASDTEATCSSSPRSAYYYYRHNMNNPAQSSAVSHLATLSRSQIGQSTGRIPSSPSVFTSDEYRAWLSRTPSTSALYEQIRATSNRPPRYTYSAENIHAAVNQADYGGYGSYRPMSSTLDRLSTRSASAQQVNLANLRASTAISSSSHRAAAVAAAAAAAAGNRPSSVANVRSSLVAQKGPLSSAANQRVTSVRRMRNMMDLESARNSIPTPTPTRNIDQRLLDINPAEFLKYKIEKPPTVGTPSSTSSLLSSLADNAGSDFSSGVSGLLWVHLLAGRGLRATTSTSAATTPSTPSGQPSIVNCGLRDLYCVLECDRVHKARTVVRTGDLMFDWDENFELDLVGNRQLDLLVYSWDPQYRHKLCYKGSVHLATLLKESPIHQLAVKVEPRGTIYLRLRYTDASQTFRRRGLPVISLATRIAPLFGIDLDTVVTRESKTGGVPGGVSTALALGGSGVPNVPIIVWRCVEEVERRGLDIIGLYRLCGSATKKRILREAFERNARSVDLSSDNVPDINVITGVLKDYLRELPEPLFTKCLYQMMVDALGVCLPEDPQGNAKLMFSILDCLPTVNKCTLIYLLDHLAMVISQCNKMSPASLAVCFGPVLMLHSDESGVSLDFQQPISVLKYLLEIWPVKSVRKISSIGSTLPRVTPALVNSSSHHQPQVSTASQILHQHHQQQQQQQRQQHHQQSMQQSHQQQQIQQQQQSMQQHQQQQQILQSHQAQQQSQSQQSGTLPRTGLPWQQQPSHHQQPPTTTSAVQQQMHHQQQIQQQQTITASSRPPPPPPIKPRQVIVSSPGSPSSEDSNSCQESVIFSRSPAANNNGGPTSSSSVMVNSKPPHPHSTNPFLNSMSNGNGNGNGNGSNGHANNGHGHINFFSTNGTNEQITPTSSVDTEDGATGHPEEGERGVEGDAEASDDDHLSKANKH